MSNQRKRMKYDIYADIIGIMRRKGLCSLTRISYGANLPINRAKKDLNFLVLHGFVREIDLDDSRRYEATKWGLEYLEAYRRMQRFFAALEEPITTEIPEVVLPGRMTTGYKDLDNLLLGGIPENYVVLLSSTSCDEKDLLIKRFLEAGAKEQQLTLYVTVQSGGLKALFENLRSNLYLLICNPQADTIINSSSNVFKLKGVENLNDINIALTSVFRELGKLPKSPRRACIEIVSDVLLQHHAAATRRWLTGLIPEFKSKGFTTLAVMDPQMHPSEEVHAILGLFEGEINVYEKETEKGSEKFFKIKRMYGQRYLESELPLRKERLFVNKGKSRQPEVADASSEQKEKEKKLVNRARA